METVKGLEAMLTAEDVARLVSRPVRWVRENLLKTGAIRAKRMGGNCWRVPPAAYREWEANGATGARFARSSGGRRAKKEGVTA